MSYFTKKALLATFALSLVAISGFANEEKVEKNWKSPQETYTKVCAYCHNTGVGDKTVTMAYPKDAVEIRAETIMYIVRHGLNAMPPFRKTEIDDEALKELATALAKGEIK